MKVALKDYVPILFGAHVAYRRRAYAEGVSLQSPGSRSAPWVHDKNDFLTTKGNAVKHFCSRIRENSGVFGIAQKSHDFSYH